MDRTSSLKLKRLGVTYIITALINIIALIYLYFFSYDGEGYILLFPFSILSVAYYFYGFKLINIKEDDELLIEGVNTRSLTTDSVKSGEQQKYVSGNEAKSANRILRSIIPVGILTMLVGIILATTIMRADWGPAVVFISWAIFFGVYALICILLYFFYPVSQKQDKEVKNVREQVQEKMLENNNSSVQIYLKFLKLFFLIFFSTLFLAMGVIEDVLLRLSI